MAVPVTAMLSPAFPADVVVPIPLHPSRLRERGYNQAALLAQPIAAQMGLAIEPAWLARDRQSGRQVEADNVAARQANVRASFAASSAIAGMRVGLVDDVMTTGATLDAAAAALKEAGAAEVHCITFARDL